MKALCVRLVGNEGKTQDESLWLTIGTAYDVLEVLWVRDRGWLLRLIGDGPNGVALFQLEMFDILSPQIPPNWIATWIGDTLFCLGPEAWICVGFWERYYDGDPDARRTFEEERRRSVNPQ